MAWMCPISKSGLGELERAHRMHAIMVHNLPESIPDPAPLATVGWMSISAVIDRMKLLFLWFVLCLKEYNVYRELMIYLLKRFLNEGVSSTMLKLSPTANLFKTAIKYNLQDKLTDAISEGDFDSYSSAKNTIKLLVKTHETNRWRATLLLYKELELYSECTHKIEMHAWAKYLKREPQTSRFVGSVLAVLMGGQPKYFQRNFERVNCQLCSISVCDTPTHILMECPALEETRVGLWRNLMEKMPANMTSCLSEMLPHECIRYLLSCLNNTYSEEWHDVYKETASFVYRIYQKRASMYDINEAT